MSRQPLHEVVELPDKSGHDYETTTGSWYIRQDDSGSVLPQEPVCPPCPGSPFDIR